MIDKLSIAIRRQEAYLHGCRSSVERLLGDTEEVTPDEQPGRKRLRIGHVSERGAVNACRTLLERNGLVVNEVDARADYGRDLLVDLTDRGELTGAVAGIQVKGDRRYVREQGPWVLRAPPKDTRFWAESSIPVLGVLWDPLTHELRWANLTAYCRRPAAISHSATADVEIPISDILDDESLPDLVDRTRAYIRHSTPAALLDLFGPDKDVAVATVHDCFALGRVDARAFLLLRRSLLSLDGEALIQAIALLSHLVDHPDILWHKGNWVPEHIQRQVRPTFRWPAVEVHHLLKVVEQRFLAGDLVWERGGLGQCLWHLLAEDPQLTAVATEAIGIFLDDGDLESAFRALTLAQGRAHDPRIAVADAMRRFPALAEHHLAQEYIELVESCGYVPVYG
ncbi:DUF4365 domain-containing protein [Mycobacterium avium]|uniref:DUF4365 domain-containing protein n=1 Tax=Mycobacterium avium TaxID=1764 RepID=UPI001314FE98|nr:DUF4365 domain-containing protein [Mycobacterium avium]